MADTAVADGVTVRRVVEASSSLTFVRVVNVVTKSVAADKYLISSTNARTTATLWFNSFMNVSGLLALIINLSL